MKKTKIICSIGPASSSFEIMKELVLNGMNCIRINFSHAIYEECLKIIDIARLVRKETKVPIAIMYDTKGPEFRTLDFEHEVFLKKGDTIKVLKDTVIGNSSCFSVNHPQCLDKVTEGNHFLIDNALLDLVVIKKERDYLILQAMNEGSINSHKSINIPGVFLDLPFISDNDYQDITFASKHSCDYLALSFVNSKEDVEAARKIIEESGGDAMIISKIETKKGFDNIDSIIAASDGIMIARGDLGVDIALEEIPILQKEIIKKCRENGKFAIVATEMLASMYQSPRPTRAEVSDVANAVLDGTDCVMLSGETTVGKYPVSSCNMMNKICEFVESTIDYTKHPIYKGKIGISDTISKLVVDAVEYEEIKAIVTTTLTGFTARKISNLRPNCNILACCPSNHIAEKVSLNFGVEAIVCHLPQTTDEMQEELKNLAKDYFNLKEGDYILITGGFPYGKLNIMNSLRIVQL